MTITAVIITFWTTNVVGLQAVNCYGKNCQSS